MLTIRILITTCLVALSLIQGSIALAADASYYLPCIEESKGIFNGYNPCSPGANDFRDYIARFFSFAYATAGILGVGMITYGGLMYTLSETVGSKQQGQAVIQRTVWGIVLLMGSYFILQTVNPAIVDFSKLPGGSLGEDAAIKRDNILPINACLGEPNDEPGKNCREVCKTPEELANKCPSDSKKASEMLEEGECVLCAPDPLNPTFCPKEVFTDQYMFACLSKGSKGTAEKRDSGAIKVTFSEATTVSVPDCGLLSTLGQPCGRGYANTKNVDIKKGGAVWIYPYYIKDQGISSAQCEIYAYQVESNSHTQTVELTEDIVKC